MSASLTDLERFSISLREALCSSFPALRFFDFETVGLGNIWTFEYSLLPLNVLCLPLSTESVEKTSMFHKFLHYSTVQDLK